MPFITPWGSVRTATVGRILSAFICGLFSFRLTGTKLEQWQISIAPSKLLLLVFAVIIHARYYDFYYPSKLIIIQFTSYILQNTMSNIDLGGIGEKNFIPVEIFIPLH